MRAARATCSTELPYGAAVIEIELSDAELAEIEAASAQIEVVETRYTEAMERTTGL